MPVMKELSVEVAV